MTMIVVGILVLPVFLVLTVFSIFRLIVNVQNYRRCVFCSILHNKLPGDVIFRGPDFFILHDIRPEGLVHLLVIANEHALRSVHHLNDGHASLVRAMSEQGLKAAAQVFFEATGRRTDSFELRFVRPPFNTVFHLHLHVISKPFTRSSVLSWIGSLNSPALSRQLYVSPEQLIEQLDEQARRQR